MNQSYYMAILDRHMEVPEGILRRDLEAAPYDWRGVEEFYLELMNHSHRYYPLIDGVESVWSSPILILFAFGDRRNLTRLRTPHIRRWPARL